MSTIRGKMVHVFVIFIIISVCPSGTYGVACNATCEKCRDVNKCDHVNGKCLTGCVAGYMGDLCNICEYICKQILF